MPKKSKKTPKIAILSDSDDDEDFNFKVKKKKGRKIAIESDSDDDDFPASKPTTMKGKITEITTSLSFHKYFSLS